MATITVVSFKVGQEHLVKGLDSSLRSMQEEVGGFIQMVPLSHDLALVCDEEGKVTGKAWNRLVISPAFTDLIAGDFFICGISPEESDFTSLDSDQVERVVSMSKFWKQLAK